MIKFYRVRYYTYHNGEQVGFYTTKALLDEKEVNIDTTIEVTWDNLKEFYYNYAFALPFNIWNFKKGRLISFFDAKLRNKNTWDIKEWKEPTNIQVEIIYTETQPDSLNEILNWHVVSNAIQYLKEQGLAISLTK